MEKKRRSARFLPSCCAVILVTLSTWVFPAVAAPYGDPNQPYDRLPGTLETSHVKWATPLADGKLSALFIIPYKNAREVVELRQRLDLDYTTIMVAGKSSWWQGYMEGRNPSPVQNGEAVVNRLAGERLDLARRYDVIVIGKVSWEIIPPAFKDLILQHVRRGTALVYVSPNRCTSSWTGDTPEATTEDAQYDALFARNHEPYITSRLTSSLPFDVIPLLPVPSGRPYLAYELSARLHPPPRAPQDKTSTITPGQAFLSVRAGTLGKGRVVVLDYADKGGTQASENSLTPEIYYDPVMYDYAYAMLAKCVLFAVDRESTVKGVIDFNPSPDVSSVALEDSYLPTRWGDGTPAAVFDREDLPNSRVILSLRGEAKADTQLTLDFKLRNLKGDILQSDSSKITITFSPGKRNVVEKAIPMLQRGDYLVDLRVLDSAGAVKDFASRSFRVETVHRVRKVKTDKEFYEKGETIQGEVRFSQALAPGQEAQARAIDTWARDVSRVAVAIAADRRSGTFSIPVENPLSRLWDIAVVIRDAEGEVDSAKTWVGLPDWNFDEYLMPLIFCATPTGGGWKGYVYAEQARKYGINAANLPLIYGYMDQYEDHERAHLISMTFAEHHGQIGHAKVLGDQYEQAFSESCMARRGQMARYIADTGKLLDPEAFPQTYSQWQHDANYINRRVSDYQETLKFGTPYFALSGEEFQSGEMGGRENACFCSLCAENFQAWCRNRYNGDLKALNAEWGSAFGSWDEVRGILLGDAAKNDQLPRWVAFRHYMRSYVWSQFFIDWTDMMRRVLGRDIRTATNGHDQYDFSRFRDHMTSGKSYGMGGFGGHRADTEYLECVGEELRQSFSGDRSFLTAPETMMVFGYDQQTPLNNHRWPWKVLFAGFRGFDWEHSSASSVSLGGMSCFTPDFSEPMPFLKNMSEQVRYLQRGIGKLCNTSKPERGPVAILWSPINHYISRLFLQKNGQLYIPNNRDAHIVPHTGFTGTWLYNVSVDGGAIGDALVMMKNLRIRPTFIAPEDLENGGLEKRGFKALILPYNKGMSDKEANAIRTFVNGGGLVIADNEPGTWSRFGRKRERGSLIDLFPVTDRVNVTRLGKGRAVYAPNGINGYLRRMQAGDTGGADIVGAWLSEFAGVTPTAELTDGNGNPRRDTLMPVYLKGTAKFIGCLRAVAGAEKAVEQTTVSLDKEYYVWDVRNGKGYGKVDTFETKIDMYPKFFALLPANPQGLTLNLSRSMVKQGDVLKIAGKVAFDGGTPEEIAGMGGVVHVAVFSSKGQELEWYRDNLLFEGTDFETELPISFSEEPGAYTVKVEYPITGMKSEATFEVRP